MSTKPVMAFLDGGMHYHVDSYEREPLKGWFDRIIYLRDLPVTDLSGIDILIVPCRTNPHWLEIYSEQLQGFMRDGGTLAVFGETRPDLWLPGVGFAPVETNFWWWLEEGADLGVEISDPSHSLARYVTKADATYHLHSTFTPLAPHQHKLIEDRDGEALMFEDVTTYGPGRLVCTSLDPFFHHGAFFMPATTRFLLGVIPWLSDSHAARMEVAA